MGESWLRFLATVLYWLGSLVGPGILIVALICLLRYWRLTPQFTQMISGLALTTLMSLCTTALFVADRYDWLELREFQTVLTVTRWISTAGWICFWVGLILVLRHVTSRLQSESSNGESRWEDGSLEE